MKILMVHQPLGNRGDESAHRGLLRIICKTFPEVSIEVLFLNERDEYIAPFDVDLPNVKYVNVKPRVAAFARYRDFVLKHGSRYALFLHPTMWKILPYYTKCDMVLCAPGGINMGGFQSWYHLFYLWLAKFCHKPIAYYGRSIGPFPTETAANRRFKKLSYELLHYFSFISLRDKKSEDIANGIGVNYVSTVDSAFLDSPHVEVPSEISELIGNDNYIVFVPNALTWHYAYRSVPRERVLNYFCRMTDILFKHFPTCKLVMLPQLYGQGVKMNDVLFFREIADKKKDNRIIVVDDIYGSDIQQSIVSKAKLVVGARYHSIVFAINNNTPFISLSYEHKMSGLLESLGIDDSLLDLTHSFDNQNNVDESLEQFSLLVRNVKLKDGAQQKAKDVARKCFDKFAEVIKTNKLHN